MTAQVPVISVVVPCYNEEAVLPETSRRLLLELSSLADRGQIDGASGVYFVDDGSTDSTWHVIEALAAGDGRCHGIRMSRNRGHQNAILCGLLSVNGDAVISIDADLQDDPAAMADMVEAFRQGSQVVYGVRRNRSSDPIFKRWTASAYYSLVQALGAEIVAHHADYRLLGRPALAALAEYPERNLFLRGIVPQLGFRSARVYYDRATRFAGTSKYPLGKMVGLALDGVTSFSAAPLRAITLAGFALSGSAFAVALWAVWARIATTRTVPGWASILIPLAFLGGIQLLCTGIIGQYLAKVYMETKARPRFTIEKII